MRKQLKKIISTTLALAMMTVMLSVCSAEAKAAVVNGDTQITSANPDTTAPTGSMATATYSGMIYPLISLTLNDDVGVAGYYWGTHPTNLRFVELEPGHQAGKPTVTTLAAAVIGGGTYYMQVIDTSGNLSPIYSMTYSQIMFDLNDGSSTPTCLMAQRGKICGVPQSTRTGYVLRGWSEDKTASYGTTTMFKADRDKTLYAIWEDVTAPTGEIRPHNNVTTSQLVQLVLSDTANVAGYYWGTNSNPSDDDYIPVTPATNVYEDETVLSAGTYYLLVKDAAGNVSTAISKTFYKTTFNANGGNVEPEYVITASGYNFALPTPTRSGYTFQGWSESSTATSGITGNYTPTGDVIYYATWIKDET